MFHDGEVVGVDGREVRGAVEGVLHGEAEAVETHDDRGPAFESEF